MPDTFSVLQVAFPRSTYHGEFLLVPHVMYYTSLEIISHGPEGSFLYTDLPLRGEL